MAIGLQQCPRLEIPAYGDDVSVCCARVREIEPGWKWLYGHPSIVSEAQTPRRGS